MKNEYIEVVKKWQAGEEVSGEQLRANADSANDAAFRDIASATRFAAAAACAAVWDDATEVSHWVKRYEEVTRYGHEELTDG